MGQWNDDYGSAASLNVFTARQHIQYHEEQHQPRTQQQHQMQELHQQTNKQRQRQQPRRQQRPLCHGRKRTTSCTLILYLAFLCLLAIQLPLSDAFRIMDWVDGETPEQFKNDDCAKVLSLSEISHLRVREIQRKLQRRHGYGSDEVYRILDKKDLVNTLAYEEHKVCERELERKKKVMVRRSIFMALVCVILVMFRPLLEHVWEVVCINFVVYTDKRTHEAGRCRELKSFKGFFGILLLSLVEGLHFWLTVSVILSWVMTSKYFFPIPSVAVRPAALLAGASGMGGGNNPLAGYGINIGPMVVTFCLRFVKGRIEMWMGRVLDKANRQQKSDRKEARKARDWMDAQDAKQERKAARAVRRADRETQRQVSEAAESNSGSSIKVTIDSAILQTKHSNTSEEKCSTTAMNNGGPKNSNGEGIIEDAIYDSKGDLCFGMNDLD